MTICEKNEGVLDFKGALRSWLRGRGFIRDIDAEKAVYVRLSKDFKSKLEIIPLKESGRDSYKMKLTEEYVWSPRSKLSDSQTLRKLMDAFAKRIEEEK